MRARLPWVAHFSDPWADSPYATRRQRSIWKRMEEDVIREASAVVFVTDETAELTMAKYPDRWRKKVAVVPHGFDPAVTAAAPPPPDPRRPLRLVHTGRFYSGIRTPMALLRALAELNRRESMRAGRRRDVRRTARRRVPARRGEARRRILRALQRPRAAGGSGDQCRRRRCAAGDRRAERRRRPSVFLPSKLVDYLPFRKPILGITPDAGASARTAAPSRLSDRAAGDDEAAITSALGDLVRRWRAGTLGVGAAFDEAAADFDINRTARLLDDVMIRAFG